MMKRLFDVLLSFILLFIFLFPLAVISVAVRLTSRGPILHWSKRIGRFNQIFLMPKFRSMKIDTPQVATHLMTDPDQFLTSIGNFLRKTSLDELPQLYSVLIGDMSFVGPRPALFNQEDLMDLRTKKSIDSLRPGITGWAQINGRDELPIPVKVDFDEYYLKNRTFWLDLRIIVLTGLKVFRADGVSH